MDEELVAGRLTELRANAKQLTNRRAEITVELDSAPTAPEPAALCEIADHVTEVIQTGTPNQRKALVEAVVPTSRSPDRTD
jgi:site-specific DNA recombinase